jgi:CDP-diglyceride synthetase
MSILANVSKDADFLVALVGFVACSTILLQQQPSLVSLLQGIFLITIPFRAWFAVVSEHDRGFVTTVSLLLTVWNCDTGALISGRLFGTSHQSPSL